MRKGSSKTAEYHPSPANTYVPQSTSNPPPPPQSAPPPLSCIRRWTGGPCLRSWEAGLSFWSGGPAYPTGSSRNADISRLPSHLQISSGIFIYLQVSSNICGHMKSSVTISKIFTILMAYSESLPAPLGIHKAN